MENIQEKHSSATEKSTSIHPVTSAGKIYPAVKNEQDLDDLVHHPEKDIHQQATAYDADDLVHTSPVLPVTDEEEIAEAMHRDIKRGNL